MLGTAARQLSVGYKIVALLIVGERQIRARTSKWNKLTLIWIIKSESEISEICSYESLPVRTAAAAGRRNSSRPVHNSSFQFQSILQDRENATLGHMTPLKGLRFTNVLRDTLLHRISIVLQWSQVKQYKTYQCTLRDTHSLMNKDVLKIVIKHVTPDMLHVTAGCFYVDISHCTESVSIPPNCWLVMNHNCRLYAWLHIGLALQVKLLLCFHSSSLLPIKNEQCLCNSIQKDSFLG